MEPKNYNTIYRIMHWSIAICMVLLMITVFLRLTWLNKYNVSEILLQYTESHALELTEDESIQLAKKIRQPMWEWHIYLGYILSGLYAIRLLFSATGHMKFPNPLNSELNSWEKTQKWMYLIFYVFMFISLTTGLIIKFGPKDWKAQTESIHELSIYYVIAYIILHMTGVFRAEFTQQKGIISRIISGNSESK